MPTGIPYRALLAAGDTGTAGGGGPSGTDALLLEGGDFVLLEIGDHILYETTPSAPSAPGGLSASTGTNEGEIDLAWTDNSSTEDGFIIERSASGSGGWATVTTKAANSTSHTDTGLTPGDTYYYRVAAYRGASISSWSATGSAASQGVGGADGLNDNFNDNSINTNQWYIIEGADGNAASATITEQNQRLESSITGGSGTDDNHCLFVSELAIRGDFDIQVDFGFITEPSSGWNVFLRAYSRESDLVTGDTASVTPQGRGNEEVRVLIRYETGTGKQYGVEYRHNGSPSTVDGAGDYTATSDSSGKLRITRSSTTAHGYYWNGSGWTEIGTGSTVGTEDMTITLWFHRDNTTDDVEMYFDNFTVNSGTLVRQY